MFDIGPSHLMVLAIVGVLVLGPEKLPGLARDAARMLRSLRELAAGARTQLQDGLGPDLGRDLGRELAALDPRKLNPRAFLHEALLTEPPTDDTVGSDNAARLDRQADTEARRRRPMPHPRPDPSAPPAEIPVG